METVVLDLSHTAHCPGQTGIQRVCRHLGAQLDALGAHPTVLIYDRYARRWRLTDAIERGLISPAAAEHPGRRRGEVWSFTQKIRGRLGQVSEPDWAALRGAPLLVPEIFTPRVFSAYTALRSHLGGPAGAIFYDAVVLRYPELSPPASVARFPAYLRELAMFDGVAAISEASRVELLEHWKRLGVHEHPPVTAIPLAIDPLPSIRSTPPAGADDSQGPLILCVGTIEGRKNHLALLEAAEILWSENRRLRLVLAGMPRPETAGPALRRAAALQAAGCPLETPGPVSDTRLRELYSACRFTVYPSLYEGFGLPVLESLQHGRPCICGSGGALAETAAGGGCLMVAEPTTRQLTAALRSLLADDALHTRLTREAADRQFQTWADYTRQLVAWLGTLRSH